MVSDALPSLAEDLRRLLLEQGEIDLAAEVAGLRIVDRCRCGDDFCATFYVRPKPMGAYRRNHRNIELTPKEGMLILDIVGDNIACVEVLYNDQIKSALDRILP